MSQQPEELTIFKLTTEEDRAFWAQQVHRRPIDPTHREDMRATFRRLKARQEADGPTPWWRQYLFPPQTNSSAGHHPASFPSAS